MKQEIAKKWVEALRSGEYKQTDSVLCQRYPDGSLGHCCLGVLCRLNDKVEVIEKDNELFFDAEKSVLPFTVKNWAEMKTVDGNFDLEDNEFNSLVEMNDDGVSFLEIADFIEKNYEIL